MEATGPHFMPRRGAWLMLERLAFFASLAVGGIVFLWMGWSVLRPPDPEGPITLVYASGVWTALVLLLVMSAVVSAVATTVAGWRLLDIGTVSVGVGLALLSLKGSTVDRLLLAGNDASGAFERALAWRFLLEFVAWCVVMIVALVTSGAVSRLLFGSGLRHGGLGPVVLMAVQDVRGSTGTTKRSDGLVHSLLVAGVGLAVFQLISVGLARRAIEPGQVCFVVAASVVVGVYVAVRVRTVYSPLWALLGVVLMGLTGYVWSAVSAGSVTRPPGVPSNHFLRALPVQYVSVGVTAAILSFWGLVVPRIPRRDDSDS